MHDIRQRRKLTRPKEGGRLLAFPARARLFDSAHPCSRVYLLRSGQVQLDADRGAIVEYLGRGDFFGEQCLLGKNGSRLRAKCLSPVEVSAFRKSELLACVQQDRRFAARLFSSLARRLERYVQTVQDAILEKAERRLVLLLYRFLPNRPVSGWVALRVSPSNSELARTIGSTRWRIAHFMGHFQRLGWLQRRPELWVLREGVQAFLDSTREKV